MIIILHNAHVPLYDLCVRVCACVPKHVHIYTQKVSVNMQGTHTCMYTHTHT